MNVKIINLSHYQTVKKGKHVLANLLDYFLVVIFSFALFSLFSPLYQNFGFSLDNQNKYQLAQDETIDILRSTHLQDYDETSGRFLSMQESGRNYIISLLKSSCYINNVEYYENENNTKKVIELTKEDSFSYQDDKGYYVNDNLAYYFISFRNENESSFNSEIEKYSLSDLNTKLLDLSGSNAGLVDESFDVSSPITLSSDNCEKVMDYLYFSSSTGATIYSQILNLYLNTAKKGINEIESQYTLYLNTLFNFQKYYYSYTKGYSIVMIICYLLSFLICYLLFPMIFKRGRTISYRFLSLFPLRNDEEDLSAVNYIIKYVFLFLEFFSSIFFLPLFIGKLTLLSSPLLGSITLFQLCAFSFFLSLISIIFSLISKDNQFLSEFASSSYVVDILRPYEEIANGQ